MHKSADQLDAIAGNHQDGLVETPKRVLEFDNDHDQQKMQRQG